jgi:hypothetical protein
MMEFRHVAAAAFTLMLAWPSHAAAVELTGAWATDSHDCNNVFVRRGQNITFGQYPGIHGGGFIIEADRLRGKHATCKIKTRKEDGDRLNLIAECAGDIMYSNVQFVLKSVDENTLVRVFPGIDGIDVTYHRCRL